MIAKWLNNEGQRAPDEGCGRNEANGANGANARPTC